MAAAPLLLALTIAGCGDNAGSNAPAPHATATERLANEHDQSLIHIAQEHLRQHNPEWTIDPAWHPVIVEHADYWLVIWELPQNTLGGSPHVRIEKATRKATQIHHTQ